MSWYAIDAVEDALDVTRGFLLPFDLRRWLTLALMVFFLGGAPGAGGGVSNGTTTVPAGPDGVNVDLGPIGTVDPTSPAFLNLMLIAVGAIVVLGLAYALVGAVMRFVFVDALRTREARIRGRFGARTGKGLHLFGFELVLLVVTVAPLAVGLAGLLLEAFGVVVLALAFLVFLPVALISALLYLFTTEFVVPVMIAADIGVLAGWRRLWPTLTAEWKQFGVYLVVRFVLGIAVSFLVGIVTGVLAVPLGVLAALGLFGSLTSVATAVLVAVAVPLVLLFLVVSLLVLVPVQSYLTYFSLLVLGDANEAFDLIPEYRADARGV